MKRWLTPDPLDYLDGNNLYRYVKNNPQRYHDPDGRFAFVIPLAIVSFEMGAAVTSVALPTIYTALAATAATATYFGIKAIDAKYGTHLSHDMNGAALFTMNTANTMNTIETSPAVEEGEQQAQESPQATADNTPKKPKFIVEINPETGKKRLQINSMPDDELPMKNDEPYTDEDDDHYQVAYIEGSREKYVKMRDWKKGKDLQEEIDFTTHGRGDHKNPHKHKYSPNKTGGTKKRGSPTNCEDWEQPVWNIKK